MKSVLVRRLGAAVLAVVVALLAVGLPTPSASGLGSQVGKAVALPGTVPSRLLSVATKVGPLAAAKQLTIQLPLALTNQTALNAYVAGEYDPKSPDFHRYLKPAAFGRRFGAAPSQIASVDAVLTKLGLSVAATAKNRLYVSATAPVATLEQVFGTQLESFQLAHPLGMFGIHRFFSNVTDIKLPGALRGLVTGVLGLDDSNQPYSHLKYASHTAAAEAAVTHAGAVGTAALKKAQSPKGLSVGSLLSSTSPTAVPTGIDGGASPCAAAVAGVGYTAPQLAAAYNFNGLYAKGYLGQGMTMAVGEWDDYHDSNVAAVENCYGLSTPVTRRLVDGGIGGVPEAGEGEVMADITTALEMLPDLSHLYVYEGPASASLDDPAMGEIDTYNAYVTDDVAPVLSISWGTCEEAEQSAYEQLYGDIAEEAAAQGQAIYDAAGDSGAEDCPYTGTKLTDLISAEGPASVPWVTGVGGTDLSQESTIPGDGIHREDVWNDGAAGGGGQSSIWAMPAWQSAYLTATHDVPNGAIAGSATTPAPCGVTAGYCRMEPDLSADADNSAGSGTTPPDFTTQGDAGSAGYSFYCGTSNCAITGVTLPTNGAAGGLGGWEPVGGTSLATPLVASAAVLWDQEAKAQGIPSGIGFINPSLYAIAANATDYANDFYDVTTGNNSDEYGGCTGSCNPNHLYGSGTGYDMASGLGSINAANLGASLVQYASQLTVTPSTEQMYGYTADPQNPGSPGPSTTAPVSITGGADGGDDTATSNASWLVVSPTGSAPGQLSWSVNPRGLPAGTYTGTITIANGPSAASQTAAGTLTVSYTVTPPAEMSVSPATLNFSEPAVSSSGTATTATCGSTLWGDEDYVDAGGSSSYAVPASSKQTLTIANQGASGSQLHYLVQMISPGGSWLAPDFDTATSLDPTGPAPLDSPTAGTVSAGASSGVALASEGNLNASDGYPNLNQGSYWGEAEVIDEADPAATIVVPATLVLGTGAGTPTIGWDLNDAGSSDAPIQITAAPGASTSFNLVLSDAGKTCGYVYSLGVANLDGSESPTADPSASWMSVSSPYLAAGTLAAPGTGAASAPTSATDTGGGNGNTPIDITAPEGAGTYQGYIVVGSENAEGNSTYGPSNLTGGPANAETGNAGTSPVGAPGSNLSGDPTYVPVCLTVTGGATTAVSTGSTGACPVSTGTSAPTPPRGTTTTVTSTTTLTSTVTDTTTTPASTQTVTDTTTEPGSTSTRTVSSTVTQPGSTVTQPGSTVTTPGETTPGMTSVITITTPTGRTCRVDKNLIYVQHPAAPALETKAVIFVNGRRVKTIRQRQIFSVTLPRPKGNHFVVKYVSYLNDGEVVSHSLSYTGCAAPKQVTKVLHRPTHKVKRAARRADRVARASRLLTRERMA